MTDTPDSLAAIVDQMRNHIHWEADADVYIADELADRIERLDAEIREEKIVWQQTVGYCKALEAEVQTLENELDVCKSLLADPRVRALLEKSK